MSDIPHDYRDRLDLREQIARIDRSLDEAAKFRAEARKFNRDPWFVLVGAIVALLAARLPEVMKMLGIGH